MGLGINIEDNNGNIFKKKVVFNGEMLFRTKEEAQKFMLAFVKFTDSFDEKY